LQFTLFDIQQMAQPIPSDAIGDKQIDNLSCKAGTDGTKEHNIGGFDT
jgi:hypothetical protein